MPWTFAHPAAVLPLRRFCPAHLKFSALVIGSMMPDLGYYLNWFDLAQFAHTFPGSFLVCLPTGCALLAALYLLRNPLCFLLPQPHRAALTSLTARPPSPSRPPPMRAVAVSVVVGAWTHIAWDSFTHKGAWAVSRVTLLQQPLFQLGSTKFPAYYALQQLSTVAGAATLVGVYWMALHQRPRPTSNPSSQRDERRRYMVLLVVAATSLLIAVSLALYGVSGFAEYLSFRVFVFRTAVYATAAFIPLLVVCSLLFYALLRQT